MCKENHGLPDFSFRYRPVLGIHFSPNRGKDKSMHLKTNKKYNNTFLNIKNIYQDLFKYRIFNNLLNQLENDFIEQVNIVKRLYDRRSKYVHEGKSAGKNDIEEAEKVCIEVLWCLLAVSGSGKVDDRSSWLKQLDFVSGGIEASKSISDSDIQSLGIPALGSKRIPPNRIIPVFAE